jgi:hypothetical protein
MLWGVKDAEEAMVEVVESEEEVRCYLAANDPLHNIRRSSRTAGKIMMKW